MSSPNISVANDECLNSPLGTSSSSSSSSLVPPGMDLTPLHLLDQLLHSIMTENKNIAGVVTNSNNDANHHINSMPNSNKQSEEDDKTLERILKSIEFLYGNDCVSLVEGALSILDSHNRHPTVSSKRIAPVRLVRAVPSGRQVMVVQGGSSSTTNSYSSNYHVNHKEYACQLGIPYHHFANGSNQRNLTTENCSNRNKALGKIGFHCTCRSFHERSKKKFGPFEICKHLLAVRLAPVLQQHQQQKSQTLDYYYAEENVSDEEYAQIMIRLYS